jgi:hypothetical protein
MSFVKRLFPRHHVACHVPHVDLRPLRSKIDVFLFGQVIPCHNHADALQCFSLGGVDRLDLRVGVRALQNLSNERTRQRIIVPKLCRTRHLRHAVRARSNQTQLRIYILHQ